MSNRIGNGFMYEVFDKGDGTVQKLPRKVGNTSGKREEYSLKLHKKYLGDLIVPDTDIFIPTKKIITSSSDFEIYQNKIVKGKPVDLVDTTNEKVIGLLEGGFEMQKDNNVLFDIFGMEGMVQLFNYYYKGTPIKSFNDFFLPANAKYLKLMHNFPEELLINLNKMDGNPFIAYNILEDEEGNIHFIDTDYRPLDVFHPLNMIGNWITKKALKDIKKMRFNKKNLN